MDIATLIGIILGLGAIIGSIFLMTPDFGMFVSVSSFGIVFGGMIASVAVAFPLKDVLQLGAAMGAVFKGSSDSLGDLVEEAVEASEAGRKGTADLEKHIDNIKGFFFFTKNSSVVVFFCPDNPSLTDWQLLIITIMPNITNINLINCIISFLIKK